MRIVWTIHALERIAQRDIHKEQVRECLLRPDIQRTDSYGNPVFVRKIDDHVLVVVAQPCGNACYKIITAFESSRVKRYLSGV